MSICPDELQSRHHVGGEKLLGVAIALYGLTLDGRMLLDLGIQSAIAVVLTIAITLRMSQTIGRLFKLDDTLSLSIGIGTAICGSAAIVATKDIIKADETQTGIGIAVINFIGTIGIFLLPNWKRPFTSKYHSSWIPSWQLTQAVGQVVAAGFSVNEATGQIATIVKWGV